LGGSLGAYYWPLPFFLVAGAGLLFALLYLFTFEPQRGQAEPELAALFQAGGSYHHHIQWADLGRILAIKTNRWLLSQAFIGTVGYGSWVWLSRLFIARLETSGHSLETATVAGNMLSLLFQTGFYSAILGGYLGDRWQQRHPGGRAWLSLIGIVTAIPFQVAVFFIPLRDLHFPEQADLFILTLSVLLSLVTNPWVATTFIVAVFAIALTSLDIPNQTALFSEVNLPEHRGTIAGLLTIMSGSGLALGSWLSGLTFTWLAPAYPSPLNYALGLALFQLFILPAGFCYYRVTKTAGPDIAHMRQVLRQRAEGAASPSSLITHSEL
jgi:MFS family permease